MTEGERGRYPRSFSESNSGLLLYESNRPQCRLPCSPLKCCGRKVTLTPTSMTQKCCAPRRSSMLTPSSLGAQ